MQHLRLVHDDPPELDDDDGDDGDGGDDSIAIDATVLGTDWRHYTAGTTLPGDSDPDTIALALIQVIRAAACVYDPDTQLALEHRLLAWGSHG